MSVYRVCVERTIYRDFLVEADSRGEAVDIVLDGINYENKMTPEIIDSRFELGECHVLEAEEDVADEEDLDYTEDGWKDE